MVTDYTEISGEPGQFYIKSRQIGIEKILELTQPYFQAIVQFFSDDNMRKAYLMAIQILDKKYSADAVSIDIIREHLCDEDTIDFRTMRSAFRSIDTHYRNITQVTQLYSKETVEIIHQLESTGMNELLRNISQCLIMDKRNKIDLNDKLNKLLQSVLSLPDRIGNIIKTHKYNPIHDEFGDETFWNYSVPQVRYYTQSGNIMLKLVQLYAEIKNCSAFSADPRAGRLWGSYYAVPFGMIEETQTLFLGIASQALYQAATHDEGIKNFLQTYGYGAANYDIYAVGKYYRKDLSLWGNFAHKQSQLDPAKVLEDVTSALKLKEYIEQFIENMHKLITICGATLNPTVDEITRAFANVISAAELADILDTLPAQRNGASLPTAAASLPVQGNFEAPVHHVQRSGKEALAEISTQGALGPSEITTQHEAYDISSKPSAGINPFSSPSIARNPAWADSSAVPLNLRGDPNLSLSGIPYDQLSSLPASSLPLAGDYTTGGYPIKNSLLTDLMQALQSAKKNNFAPLNNNGFNQGFTDDFKDHFYDDFAGKAHHFTSGDGESEYEDKIHTGEQSYNHLDNFALQHNALPGVELFTDRDGKHVTVLYRNDAGITDMKRFTIVDGRLIEEKNDIDNDMDSVVYPQPGTIDGTLTNPSITVKSPEETADSTGLKTTTPNPTEEMDDHTAVHSHSEENKPPERITSTPAAAEIASTSITPSATNSEDGQSSLGDAVDELDTLFS